MRQSLLNNTPLVVDKLFEGVHQGEFNQWQVFFFSSIEMRGPTLRNSFPLVKSQVFFFSACEWMGKKGVLHTTKLRNHLSTFSSFLFLHGSREFLTSRAPYSTVRSLNKRIVFSFRRAESRKAEISPHILLLILEGLRLSFCCRKQVICRHLLSSCCW
jgi:hypothetical protein